MASNCGPGVDDIEDIVTKDSQTTDLRSGNRKHVVPRARKVKAGQETIDTDVCADSVIPGMCMNCGSRLHVL